MFSVRGNTILFTLFFLSLFQIGFAQTESKEKEKQALENGLDILKTYFSENKSWHVIDPSIDTNVNSLINFIEDQPIDDIIRELNNAKLTQGSYVLRLPEDVDDSLSVPGYVSAAMVLQNIERIGEEYRNEVKIHEIMVPTSVVVQAESEVEVVPEGKGIQLFMDSTYVMPDSLMIPEVIPDSVLNSEGLFHELIKTDSIRKAFIEDKRLAYNDSIKAVHINAVVREYRQQRYQEGLTFRIKRYKDQVRVGNYMALKTYNDVVVAEVNDSIKAVIDVLTEYADFIDTIRISITNLAGQTEEIRLQNGNERFSRIWLKNEQNDSLRILVKNTDKRSIHMLIDDGVTFSRFKEKETVGFDFETLKVKDNRFNKVGNSYELETPWRIGGEGSAGFTQTYLENWKKGGKSAIASLIVLKGFANYSRKDGKIKWENTGEIRNGWIRPGGSEAEIQKNDDKFEITSRYGLSAFKKWYYSGELNFNTQFFKGYRYPIEEGEKPISAFLAPSKTYLKVGLDYKPDKDLSIFLSPLTLKNFYVRDTSMIDQTAYGIDADRKSFWEPGLNAEIKYKVQIRDDISYETKYKMFINYQDPFKKYDINWENLFKMEINNYIDMRFMVHFIYDDDVMFKYTDSNGDAKEETRLQIKEFFSIGFTYKINKKVMRTHRVR